MAYYNTNNETSPTLQKSWNQANKQKKLIHHIFTSLWSDETGVYFAPHQIKDVLNEKYRVMGNYGKKVYTWRVA